MFLVELGQTVSCQSVSTVLLWAEITHIFENTAALTASGPFRWCQRKKMRAEQRGRARKEEREVVADRDIDKRQHIGIHGWFQLTHPSLPHILYITFALQCSKCLTHSWRKLRVCSRGSRTVDHMHTPTSACMYAHTLSRRAEAKTSFF